VPFTKQRRRDGREIRDARVNVGKERIRTWSVTVSGRTKKGTRETKTGLRRRNFEATEGVDLGSAGGEEIDLGDAILSCEN